MVRVLKQLVSVHGAPAFILMDNGTEMTANSKRYWCRFTGVKTISIEPGSPCQDAYAKFKKCKIRDELLAIEEFTARPGAKIMAEDFR